MRPEIWAVITAACWSAGSFMEKSGVKLGGLHPITGGAIRTAFSLLLFIAISAPFYHEIKTVSLKPLLLIAIGGGLIAGGLGVASYYTAMKEGQLAIVMSIAFCLTPVIGAILGVSLLGEKLLPIQWLGMGCCVIGTLCLICFKP